MNIYIAQLIELGRVAKELEFPALNFEEAIREANEGMNPLSGRWVSVQKKPKEPL